jgi:hypothetical protein
VIDRRDSLAQWTLAGQFMFQVSSDWTARHIIPLFLQCWTPPVTHDPGHHQTTTYIKEPPPPRSRTPTTPSPTGSVGFLLYAALLFLVWHLLPVSSKSPHCKASVLRVAPNNATRREITNSSQSGLRTRLYERSEIHFSTFALATTYISPTNL